MADHNVPKKEALEILGIIKKLHVLLSKEHTKRFKDQELTMPQMIILHFLISEEQPIRMSTIAKHLEVTCPAVTHMIDALEKKKCVKREQSKADRRVIFITLSDKGRMMVSIMQTLVGQIIEQTLENFSLDDRTVIRRFYETLSTLSEKGLKA